MKKTNCIAGVYIIILKGNYHPFSRYKTPIYSIMYLLLSGSNEEAAGVKHTSRITWKEPMKISSWNVPLRWPLSGLGFQRGLPFYPRCCFPSYHFESGRLVIRQLEKQLRPS